MQSKKTILDLYVKGEYAFISSLIIIGILIFIFYVFKNKDTFTFWKISTFILAIVGLTLCCFVAMRDQYPASVQLAIEGIGEPGLFAIQSAQSIINCFLGALIFLCVFIALFAKNQNLQQLLFTILSCTIIIKIIIIEVSRIFL